MGDGAGAGHAAGFLIGYLVACYWLNMQTPDFSLPFGPRPLVLISLMVAIAVLCSMGWRTLLERRQPAITDSDSRPLIVFETLAGLLYYTFYSASKCRR